MFYEGVYVHVQSSDYVRGISPSELLHDHAGKKSSKLDAAHQHEHGYVAIDRGSHVRVLAAQVI